MNGHTSRTSRLAASLVAVVLAAPTIAWGANGGTPESNPILRNDIAHFGPADAYPQSEPATRANSTDTTPSTPVVVRVESGFDWVSAAVGAAGGVGLAVLGGGAVSLLRRRPDSESIALSGR